MLRRSKLSEVGLFWCRVLKENRKLKLEVFFTEVMHTYNLEIHLKVIVKSSLQVMSLSLLHNVTYCLQPAKQKAPETSIGLTTKTHFNHWKAESIKLQLWNFHKTKIRALQDACENLVVISLMVFEMLSLAPYAVTRSHRVA